MKLKSYLKMFYSVIFVFLFMCFINMNYAQADADSFKVKNNSGKKISKLYISHDDKTWTFDIGDGIDNGETITLQWAEWTDELPCKLEIMCDFADESESDEVEFDFCEKGLTLIFE
ncbi:MAG: hypothetical protein HQK76_06525 [Desulfobacterales bacterium]|nr:hypothetical protein [Desulfobacterales bacterium]